MSGGNPQAWLQILMIKDKDLYAIQKELPGQI